MSNHVFQKSHGFFKHRRTKFIRKLWEPVAIDAVMLFESAKPQPVAGKLHSQRTRSGILQHAVSFSEKHVGFVKMSVGRLF